MSAESNLREVGIPIPPEELRWLTTATRDAEEFVRSGLASRRDLERALAVHERKIASFGSILDFGVGVGRLARHLADVPRLVGTDVMLDMVEWCRTAIPWGAYVVNEELPPLPFADAEFDLIVNHSVFTHLDVDHQDAWLRELHRVLEPGGYAVLSFAGLAPFGEYLHTLVAGGERERAQDHLERFERHGHLFVDDDIWGATAFPDWYHSMFHSPSYVISHWGDFIPVVSWNRQGNLGFQDTVVCRKDV